MARTARNPEPVTAAIASMAHDGRGVVDGAGKTVFVHGALPGETVRYVRGRKKRNYDEGRTVEVLEPSPDRVDPECEFYGVCGGCAMQHLDVGRQIQAKETVLLDNLKRIGRVVPEEILAPITGPAWRYRRRARLGVKHVPKKGRVLVGFRERMKSYIADMTRCEVLAEPVGTLIEPLSELVGGLTIRARLPQVEASVADNGTALVFRVLDPPSDEDLDALRTFGRAHDLSIYLQPGGLDTVAPLDSPAPRLFYTLDDFDVRIEFEPTDFIQVNAAVNAAMVKQAVRLLSPGAQDTVLDLFSGLGNFTLPMAHSAGRVVAVEGDGGLVSRARHNAEINGTANVEYHVANLFEPEWNPAWAGGSYSKLLIDPPRAGAAAVVDHVGAFGVSRIVYVSCHPGSLARDAGALVHEHGFRLAAAGVMDMFPHTAHVESMALFTAD